MCEEHKLPLLLFHTSVTFLVLSLGSALLPQHWGSSAGPVWDFLGSKGGRGKRFDSVSRTVQCLIQQLKQKS